MACFHIILYGTETTGLISVSNLNRKGGKAKPPIEVAQEEIQLKQYLATL
jgi:hypothetical protein